MPPTPAGKKPAAPKKTTKPATRKKVAGKAAPMRDRHPQRLSPKQQRFVDEYIVDYNGTQAAIRAKYSPATANAQAARLLLNVNVQLAISAAREAQQKRTHITADRVVLEAWHQITADARELVGVHVGCCRYCHGYAFGYQRTLAEFNADRSRFLDAQQAGKIDPNESFDDQGGTGFNPHLDPNPECPQCCGDGESRTVIKDTRKLSPAAVALYAGAKHGKYGIEVLTHSKDAAMEKLFKHLGLYERDNEQKKDSLAALLTHIASTSNNGFVPVLEDPERGSKAPTSAIGVTQNPPEDDEDD